MKLCIKDTEKLKAWLWDELKRLEKRRDEAKSFSERELLYGSILTVKKLLVGLK